MIDSPNTIYKLTWPLIGVGCLLIFVLVLFANTSPPSTILIGLVFGTIFQHAVLAAAWCALGPGPLWIRGPLSFGWAVGMSLALTFALIPRQEDGLAWPFIAAALWLVAQLPLWGTAILFRLRLWHQRTYPTGELSRQGQFGIRQLMIFTGLVALCLGVGRLLVASEWMRQALAGEPQIFSFLIVAQIITGLPLLFALLLPRYVVAGTILSLVLIGITTACEAQLFVKLIEFYSSTDFRWVILWINVCSLLWTFAFALLIRWSGYHLGLPTGQSATPLKSSDVPVPHAPPVQSADSAAAR